MKRPVIRQSRFFSTFAVVKEMKKIAFGTLGCKLNFSETSDISRKIREQGYDVVDLKSRADLYVIHSCSVTAHAEKKCRNLIRQSLKINPMAHVAVIGCYSQLRPEELAKIPGVSIVLGNADKFNLLRHIKDLEQQGKESLLINEPDVFVPSWSGEERTRSFLKIQDGCDYFCTYCTIPNARGISRSNSIAETLTAAGKIAGSNARELVLTGVNIGDFGKHQGESFAELLLELCRIEGIDRIRISSVEPDLLHEEIIELVASQPRLMPHFHIPLQSGSDQVLKDMGRRYDTTLFMKRLEHIRKQIPMACIAADLIVGFPSETDRLFQESFEFIRQADISYVHVFSYSKRDNTRAATLSSEVKPEQIKERSVIMHRLSEEKRLSFLEQNKGQAITVLWEEDVKNGYMHGFTENYIRVKAPYDADAVNTLEAGILTDLHEDGIYTITKTGH